MAKMTLKKFRRTKEDPPDRAVSVHAEIGTRTYKNGRRFIACMWVSGKARSSYKVMQSSGCATGKNPRKALAAAARKFAARISGKGIPGVMATGRRGVFAGLK